MKKTIMSLIIILTILMSGCTLFKAPFKAPAPVVTPENDSADSHSKGELGPFPWEWIMGIWAVGIAGTALSAWKVPSLVDLFVVGTIGGSSYIVLLEMLRETWYAKYMIIITTVIIILALIGWKLARRYLWPLLGFSTRSTKQVKEKTSTS